MAKEARMQSEQMTESLFSNNEQARLLWEAKVKQMQADVDRLEELAKDKDRQAAEARV
jgi:hypothetical protein